MTVANEITPIKITFFLSFVDGASPNNRVKKNQFDAQLILGIFLQTQLRVLDVSIPIISR